jgi:hypothetical protein
MFTHRTALKLAAVELMDTPHRRLQPELEVILDLRPELLVVTDLDEVLNPSMSVEMRCETIRAVADIEWSLCKPRMRETRKRTSPIHDGTLEKFSATGSRKVFLQPFDGIKYYPISIVLFVSETPDHFLARAFAVPRPIKRNAIHFIA